jgi:hypothetical protein
VAETFAQETRVIRWIDHGTGAAPREQQLTTEELQGKLSELFGSAMDLRADPRVVEQEDVRRYLAELSRNIAVLASAGVVPMDRAAFMIDMLRGGTGSGTAEASSIMQTPPIVNVHVEPTPVTIENHVDASPKGDLKLGYDKLGRLDAITREPAKAS